MWGVGTVNKCQTELSVERFVMPMRWRESIPLHVPEHSGHTAAVEKVVGMRTVD